MKSTESGGLASVGEEGGGPAWVWVDYRFFVAKVVRGDGKWMGDSNTGHGRYVLVLLTDEYVRAIR